MSGDYEALSDRLKTLPDQLSYDIMVSANLVYKPQERKRTQTHFHNLCIVGWLSNELLMQMASLPFTRVMSWVNILNNAGFDPKYIYFYY